MNTKKRKSCVLLVCAAMAPVEVDLFNKLLPPGGEKSQQQSSIQKRRLHKDEYSELFIFSVMWLRAGNDFTTITESTVCFLRTPRRDEASAEKR